MALGTRLGQQYPHVAMVNAACCPALLARPPSRMLAFCEQPRLIDDEHGLGITQMFDHRGLEVIPDLIGLPRRTPSQMLDPIRRRIPMDFSHLPPVFALDGTQ